MRDDELDGILARNDDLEPSSGFTRNVMDAVRREASAPAPIAFPWKRAMPGLVLCVLTLATLFVAALVRPAPQPLHETSGPSFWTPIWTAMWTGLSHLIESLRVANGGGAGWILLALVLTLASVLLSLRLIGRRV